MRTYVLDASVAARFLLVEDLSDMAALVLEDFLQGIINLRAPKLIIYEVGNVLWKAVRGKMLKIHKAMVKFYYFLELRLDTIMLEGKELEEALSWAVRKRLTYYDALYVVSSKKIGAPS